MNDRHRKIARIKKKERLAIVKRRAERINKLVAVVETSIEDAIKAVWEQMLKLVKSIPVNSQNTWRK